MKVNFDRVLFLLKNLPLMSFGFPMQVQKPIKKREENVYNGGENCNFVFFWPFFILTSTKGISSYKRESDILRYIVCKWFFGNFLEFFGNSLGIFWEFFGNFLGIFWKFFGNFLGIFWEFFGNSLGILWEFFANGKSWQKLDDSRNLMEFFNDFEA